MSVAGEKFEFRVFLIGDETVGRKTIINRFRIMKCTETKEILFNNNSKKEEAKKKLNSLENKTFPEIKGNIDQKTISKNEYEDLQELTTKDQKSNIQKTFLQKKIENLTNFTKIFHIANTYFELNFFNCPTAENLQFSDKINEEDDVERMHKMKLDKLKKFIKTEIQKPSKFDVEVKFLFMFVFDITNQKTLERIKIYYEELNKIFLLNVEKSSNSKTYFHVLIGNKIDLKLPYENIDRDFLESFISQNKFNYYEISGKLNYNFEKFFEKMFFDLFVKYFNCFSSDYFKNRFVKLLNTTRTFSKEARAYFRMNENPGPDCYKNNPYDLGEIQDTKKQFDQPERFNKKIFVSKKGPLFNVQKKKNPLDEKFKKFEHFKSKSKQKKYEKLDIDFNKNDLNNNMFRTTEGFSIGIKNNKNLNLKKKRKEEVLERNQELDNFFYLENITTYNQPLIKVNKDVINNKRSLTEDSIRNKIKKKREESIKNMKIKSKKKMESVQKNKSDMLSRNKSQNKLKFSEEDKYFENNDSMDENDSYENYNKIKNSSNSKKFLTRLDLLKGKKKKRHIKKNPQPTPGPANYDTRGNIKLKKGFTFGSRYYNLDENATDFPPSDKIILRSDFDEIAIKPRFAIQNSSRFKEYKIHNPSYPENIYKKWDEMTMRKFTKIRENILMLHNKNSKRVEQEEYDSPGPATYNPSFKLIEDMGFSYSLRGRTGKDFFSAKDDNDTNDIRINLDKNNLVTNNRINIYPLPDYEIVKHQYPAYSFSKNERFELKENPI